MRARPRPYSAVIPNCGDPSLPSSPTPPLLAQFLERQSRGRSQGYGWPVTRPSPVRAGGYYALHGYFVAAAFSRDSMPFMGTVCPSGVAAALRGDGQPTGSPRRTSYAGARNQASAISSANAPDKRKSPYPRTTAPRVEAISRCPAGHLSAAYEPHRSGPAACGGATTRPFYAVRSGRTSPIAASARAVSKSGYAHHGAAVLTVAW
jgi:hypothetical protein